MNRSKLLTKFSRYYREDLWGIKKRNVQYRKLPGKRFTFFSRNLYKEKIPIVRTVISSNKTQCLLKKNTISTSVPTNLLNISKHGKQISKITSVFRTPTQKNALLYKRLRKYYYGYNKAELKAIFSKGIDKVLQRMESRLDVMLYRTGWFNSIISARHAIVYGHVRLNGKQIYKPTMAVNSLDKIQIISNNIGIPSTDTRVRRNPIKSIYRSFKVRNYRLNNRDALQKNSILNSTLSEYTEHIKIRKDLYIQTKNSTNKMFFNKYFRKVPYRKEKKRVGRKYSILSHRHIPPYIQINHFTRTAILLNKPY